MVLEKAFLNLKDHQINQIYNILGEKSDTTFLSKNDKTSIISKFLRDLTLKTHKKIFQEELTNIISNYDKKNKEIQLHYKKSKSFLSIKEIEEKKTKDLLEIEHEKNDKVNKINFKEQNIIENIDKEVILFWISMIQEKIDQLKITNKEDSVKKIKKYILFQINNLDETKINQVCETLIREFLFLLYKDENSLNIKNNNIKYYLCQRIDLLNIISSNISTYELLKKVFLEIKGSFSTGKIATTGTLATAVKVFPLPPQLKILISLGIIIVPISITARLTTEDIKKMFRFYEIITKLYYYNLINGYKEELEINE